VSNGIRWSKAEYDQIVAGRAYVKANKYNAKRVQVDNIWFDSKAEAKRYTELKLMNKTGLIGPITVHPKYPIEMDGVKICVVELDFSYHDYKRAEVFEDVKSPATDTPLSRLKRRLVEVCYSIKVDVIR
jgi:hypothetical protein